MIPANFKKQVTYSSSSLISSVISWTRFSITKASVPVLSIVSIANALPGLHSPNWFPLSSKVLDFIAFCAFCPRLVDWKPALCCAEPQFYRGHTGIGCQVKVLVLCRLCVRYWCIISVLLKAGLIQNLVVVSSWIHAYFMDFLQTSYTFVLPLMTYTWSKHWAKPLNIKVKWVTKCSPCLS